MIIWRISKPPRCPVWECNCTCECHTVNKYCDRYQRCCPHRDRYVGYYGNMVMIGDGKTVYT